MSTTDKISPLVCELLQRARSFQLSFRRKWGPYPAATRGRIVTESILPLLAGAEDCRVFGIADAKRRKKLTEIGVVSAQFVEVRDPQSSVALAPELWQGTRWADARCIVWSVPLNGALRSALRRMFNPMISRNASIAFPPTAWRYGLALSKSRTDRVVLLLLSTNPLDYVCFVARPQLLERVFVDAESLSKQTLH